MWGFVLFINITPQELIFVINDGLNSWSLKLEVVLDISIC
jgi:hypothetical protein